MQYHMLNYCLQLPLIEIHVHMKDMLEGDHGVCLEP